MIIQGPKLTFLYRRQVATENFFSVAKWKNLVAKKRFVKFEERQETWRFIEHSMGKGKLVLMQCAHGMAVRRNRWKHGGR